MIVISVIVTSSPNGSSGATVIGGGGDGLGVCARAPDRPKPITNAAARGSRKIRETTIENLPRTSARTVGPLGPVWADRRWDHLFVLHDFTRDWPLNRCNPITGNISARSRHGRFIQSSLCEDERSRQRDCRGRHARGSAA